MRNPHTDRLGILNANRAGRKKHIYKHYHVMLMIQMLGILTNHELFHTKKKLNGNRAVRIDGGWWPNPRITVIQNNGFRQLNEIITVIVISQIRIERTGKLFP